MRLLSLTAYGATHSASRQAAKKWQDRGLLVMVEGMVDADASDAKMMGAGKGRFRIKAHGGRRVAGVKGVIDRPGLQLVAENRRRAEVIRAVAGDEGADDGDASAAPTYAWTGWHPGDNPHTLAATLRAAFQSGDPDDQADAIDLAEFTAWDAACQDAGWDRWAASIAPVLAADIGVDELAGELRDALKNRVRLRLAALERFADDLDDPRLEPR